MFFDQRVIFSDNGSLSDKSLELNDFRSGTTALAAVASEDYLYIGSVLPFGARYIEIGTPNATASVMSVELYENPTRWTSAVDLIDMTSSSSKSLAQSGYIRFQRDRDATWNSLERSEDILPGTDIYDLYWMRLKWSVSLHASTTLKYIGHKFSTDTALYERYPDLNQDALKTQFETGKTDWNHQHYIAANMIISDLRDRKLILTGDQILDPWAFEAASVHKVAEMLYQAFGQPYLENRKEATARYKAEMDLAFKNLDLSGDANLSIDERFTAQGRFYR